MTTVAIKNRLRDMILQRAFRNPYTGCWEIPSVSGEGRPMLYVKEFDGNKRRVIAARASAFVFNDVPLDTDAFICHHCDNAMCVNPRHLYAGDRQTNAADVVRRKRQHMTNWTGFFSFRMPFPAYRLMWKYLHEMGFDSLNDFILWTMHRALAEGAFNQSIELHPVASEHSPFRP